jgi:hypothetical protein
MDALFTILLVACLGGLDHQCREFALTTDQITERGCIVVSMPALAIWQQTHPRWTLRRFTCRLDKPQLEI